MRQIKFAFFAIFLILISCSKEVEKKNILVSFAPHQNSVKKIVENRANVLRILPAKENVNSYKMQPAQVMMFKKIDIYYTLGIPCEDKWISELKSINPDIKIINVGKNIPLRKTKLNSEKLANMGYDPEVVYISKPKKGGHEQMQKALGDVKTDIYTWMHPDNFNIQIQEIYESLIHLDEKNEKFYKKNFNKLHKYQQEQAKEFITSFKQLVPSKHIVTFNLFWGYITDELSISQLPIYTEFIHPNPGEMSGMISQNLQLKTKAMFYYNQISHDEAMGIEDVSKTAVIQVNPNANDYYHHLKTISKHLDEYFRKQ